MRFVDEFEAFLQNEVNLNQTRIARLEQSVSAIERVLSTHPVFGKLFLDVIPAGSWAHRTIIRPVQENDEFDADMLLHVKEYPGWRPKEYLEHLWSTFRGISRYREIVELKKRCVRIGYAGDFHIDVVPYLERSGSHYITYRHEPKGVGCFEASDPEAFTKWIDERERWTNGHFIKAVRLIKYLRDFKNTFECKSIILMTLLGNQVNAVEAGYAPELYADLPSTLVTLLSKLANALPITMPTVMDPAQTGENFTDRYGTTWNYDNFRTCISYYAARMRDAQEEEDRQRSILKWRRVFGDTFTPGTVISKGHDPFSAAVSCTGEQFIDQPPYNFLLRVDPGFRTRITGRVTGFAKSGEIQQNGFRQFELAKRGNVAPKNRSLEFTMRTNVPAPYRLYWKVRNGGFEASRHQELRGEISEDEGSHQKVETTLYTGKHYVEGYVVKGGVVVSKDRQYVIVPSTR